MTTTQFVIYMFTILLAPLVAIQVTEYLQKRKEARGRCLWIFKTLMATRASRLSLDHVQALNMIDIEFHGRGKKSKAVLEAWKAYLNLLGLPVTPETWQVWASRRDDLFVELLYTMAQDLGYIMGKTDIRSTSYFPNAHGKVEDDNTQIRTGLLELLAERRALRVTVDNSRVSKT